MIYIMIFLCLTLIAVGIVILILKVSKKLGYKKVGIIIASLISLLFLLIPASFILEDFFFTKSNAKEILNEHGIVLEDDFKFKEKSIIGLTDYVLQFEIEISNSDKEKIINTFRNSQYKIDIDKNEMYDVRPFHYQFNKDTILYAVYEEEKFWNLQYCKILENNYIQTWDIIQVSKNENRLSLIREE